MATAQETIHSFTSDGIALAYRRFGQPGKTPILLLHGLLYFSYDWIEIATALAKDREVVALDQRGFGDSEWSPSKSYQVADFALDAKNLLDHCGWERSIVVGHSMGGRNAACMAVTYPERVAGLVLADSPPYNAAHGARRIGDQVAGVPEKFRSVEEALAYFPATPWSDKFEPSRRTRFEAYLRKVPGGLAIKRDPYFHRLFFKVKATWPYHSYEQDTWPMGQEFDVWHAWSSLQCPTRVVAGTGVGDIFSPEMVRKVERFASDKNKNIRVVPHIAHHNLPGKAPKELISDIQNLLADVKVQ